jgi:hypothetical protein
MTRIGLFHSVVRAGDTGELPRVIVPIGSGAWNS